MAGLAVAGSGRPLAWALVMFVLKIPWCSPSVYSGTPDVCTMAGCACTNQIANCVCSENADFQEYFTFLDNSRRLEELRISNCNRLVFPPNAIPAESRLTAVWVDNVGHLELQPEAVAVSSLLYFNVSGCAILVLHQEAFTSFNSDSATMTVTVTDVGRMTVKSRALASVRRLSVSGAQDLVLEPQAFKQHVSSLEAAVSLHNVSVASLASSVFSSPYRSIVISESRIDKVQTNAFSGKIMDNITLFSVAVNRIERGAFSDQSAIGTLRLDSCNISSISQKSIVAGISRFDLVNSVIQSISKYGAIHAMVAAANIRNNTFRTLGQESLSLLNWNSVRMEGNTIKFLEEGAVNAISEPADTDSANFTFANNRIEYANRRSLVTQIPGGVRVSVAGNMFSHTCDCNTAGYVRSVTGHLSLSSPFHDLTERVHRTSWCRLSGRDANCFPSELSVLMPVYGELMCNMTLGPPDCALQEGQADKPGGKTFYDEFMMLFQVKTTKGILLFMLFCVLSSVIIVTICVGVVWIHRLYKRARLVHDNVSGSFHFNSGEDRQVLYGSDQTTCHSLPEEEPQYAEIADIHPPPRDLDSTLPMGPGTATTTITTHSTPDRRQAYMTAGGGGTQSPESSGPSAGTAAAANEEADDATETSSLLSPSAVHDKRKSAAESSLTDEIMTALRDKLNDPNLYCTVLDAKMEAGEGVGSTEGLYCAPVYSDPLALPSTTTT